MHDDKQNKNIALWINADLALLLVFVVAVCFGHIHEGTLSVDGIRYAHISRTIIDRGEWFRLWDEFMGREYTNKPPVLFWLTATSFKVLGFSTFSARLPGALFAGLSLILLWTLSRRLFDTPTAWCAVLLYSLNATFFRAVTELSFEGMLVSGAILLLGIVLRLLESERLSFGQLCTGACGFFLIVFSKAPFLILILVSTTLVFLRQRKLVRLGNLVWCALPTLLFAVIWYWLFAPGKLQETYVNQLVRPFEHPSGWLHSLILWPRELGYYAPLSLLSIAVLVFALPWKQILSPNNAREEQRLLFLAWAALLVPIVLLIENRGPYLLIPALGCTMIVSPLLRARLNTLISTRAVPGFVTTCVILCPVFGIKTHHVTPLVQFFRKAPGLLSQSTMICVDGADRPTSRPTKKRTQLLLDLEFGGLRPVYSSAQLPLAELQPGTRIVAEKHCASRLGHSYDFLQKIQLDAGIGVFEVVTAPALPVGYSPEPDLSPGALDNDH